MRPGVEVAVQDAATPVGAASGGVTVAQVEAMIRAALADLELEAGGLTRPEVEAIVAEALAELPGGGVSASEVETLITGRIKDLQTLAQIRAAFSANFVNISPSLHPSLWYIGPGLPAVRWLDFGTTIEYGGILLVRGGMEMPADTKAFGVGAPYNPNTAQVIFSVNSYLPGPPATATPNILRIATNGDGTFGHPLHENEQVPLYGLRHPYPH